VAFPSTYTSSLYSNQNQSEKIYLERDKEYYYQAYFANRNTYYGCIFELGLFAGRTNFTQSYLPDLARDEQQEIVIESNARKNVQVSTFFGWRMNYFTVIQQRQRHLTTKNIK